MEINFPIRWGVNWPSNEGLLNVGLTLDTDLALLIVDTGVSEHGVTQTHIWREHEISQTYVWSGAPSCSDLRLTWNTELLRLMLEGTQGYSDSRRTQVERGLTHACVWNFHSS